MGHALVISYTKTRGRVPSKPFLRIQVRTPDHRLFQSRFSELCIDPSESSIERLDSHQPKRLHIPVFLKSAQYSLHHDFRKIHQTVFWQHPPPSIGNQSTCPKTTYRIIPTKSWRDNNNINNNAKNRAKGSFKSHAS